ncbi:hypothetical protein BDZ90DRAFT_230302 [Jaminaea rosea]|uniref:UspA domain-containing protein n=1 Tax=Jaminaea rosea TaxID=1569628 RepID=A0A316UW24_9BASI|nr:hypothetical protein BDZ90DRAFT_230302 [Jaminaea rosea]PWN29432.1 hypothetical protein BDZ90DRAFT_230302 [Jaminaea rosea]
MSGGQPPASLSWRVGTPSGSGSGSGRSSPQHQRNTSTSTSSSLASAVLPAISIALPGSSGPSSASSSSSRLPIPGSGSGSGIATDQPSVASSSSASTEDVRSSSSGRASNNSENPQLEMQASSSNSHRSSLLYPFHIGPLRTDGKSGHDASQRKARKRDKLARAGRSLSPFRTRHGRSGSLNRLGEALAAVTMRSHSGDNKLLTPPKVGGSGASSSQSRTPQSDDASIGEATEDDSTDTESVRSVGLAPRNTAFGSGRDGRGDGDEEHSGSAHDDDADPEKQRTSLDASGEESLSSESDGHRAQEDEDDSIIDFDDATIDNTLFNAGCLDLHNAWQNNKESIGEGGWYPSEDDPSWSNDEHQDEDDQVSSSSRSHPHRDHHHHGSRHSGALVDDPEGEDDEGYTQKGTRTAPVDGAPPIETSETSMDHHSRLPNVILPSSHRPTAPKKQGSKWISSSSRSAGGDEYSLVASRPIFAKNRCTITLVHGEYEKAVEARRSGSGEGRNPRRWVVASDGSEESSYAIEWTIGTVLRDGDETLIVSVMETSEKLDGSHLPTNAAGKAALEEKQRIRQSMALVLARQATALLQRTRLAVKVSCQALHAKHARHMLLDLIDFYEPTMVIVGSRGLGSLKGILLGSTSHYLLQRSSKPIMIARKRLQLPALPRGKGDVVSSVRRRHMRLDEAAIEKKSKVGEEEGADGESHSEGEEGEKEGGEKKAEEGDNNAEEGKKSEESEADATVLSPESQGDKKEKADKRKIHVETQEEQRRREGSSTMAAVEDRRLRESEGDEDDEHDGEGDLAGQQSQEGAASEPSASTKSLSSSTTAEADNDEQVYKSGAAVSERAEERGRRPSATPAEEVAPDAGSEEAERGRGRSRTRDR